MDTGIIYIIKNIINNKSYIGQTLSYGSNGRKLGINKRFKTHINNSKNNKNSCRILENAIRKYGSENFVIIEICKCNIENLNSNEIKYIKIFNTVSPNGYNLQTGGGNGRKHNESTKKLMSQTRIGMVKSDDTKNLISKMNKGLIVNIDGRKNIGKASKWRNMSDANKNILENALKKLNIPELPMYISLSIDKRGISPIPIIHTRHPAIKNKKFASKNIPLDKKIQLAINYLSENIT